MNKIQIIKIGKHCDLWSMGNDLYDVRHGNRSVYKTTILHSAIDYMIKHDDELVVSEQRWADRIKYIAKSGMMG